MKKFLTIASLLISVNVFAGINMACVTEIPTTSFVAMTEGDETIIRLIHHNGPKYMPIWGNIITPNDLPNIQEAANALYDLGSVLDFKMPAKACEQLDGMLINCFGTQPAVEMGGHQVSLWAVHTSESVEKSFAGEYAYVKSSLSLDVDGKTFHVPMKYSDYECFKANSASELRARLKSKNLFLK